MSYNCISTRGERCTNEAILVRFLLPEENDLLELPLRTHLIRTHESNKQSSFMEKFEQRTGRDQPCSSGLRVVGRAIEKCFQQPFAFEAGASFARAVGHKNVVDP